jgi:hypothetical protein
MQVVGVRVDCATGLSSRQRGANSGPVSLVALIPLQEGESATSRMLRGLAAKAGEG